MKIGKHIINSTQMVVLGFGAVILLGALFLMLPVSSVQGLSTPFVDALFTAASSVCVTGLVTVDTGTYWSVFGQAVILILIQIGGLGVVTLAASFMMLAGRKIGLLQRSAMQNALSAHKLGGIVRLTRFILFGTFLIEFSGAALMAPTFIRDFGVVRGLWFALFHSVSAFCNAGLDLLGILEPYSSLSHYAGNVTINLVVMSLIVIGGIGFLTWDDIVTHRHRFYLYRMQTKVILATTGLLILIPAILFFFLEFSQFPLKERILMSLFQAITPRTAGMSTADLTAMSEPGQLTTIVLMLIGGSPGSTAGGMKTTTFAVILGCACAVFRRRDSAQFYGRRISADTVATACTLALLYLGISIGGALLISYVEQLPILTCLYETASAVATVGLTLGITPQLSVFSKYLLIAMMYIGRVGGLTLIYAALSSPVRPGRLPLDHITVG